MIDIYVDDMKLQEIEEKYGQYVLMFKNAKDESLQIAVDEEELKNIQGRVTRRCEVRGLIKNGR